MRAGSISLVFDVASEGAVKNVAYKGGFSRSAHAGNGSEYAQREFGVDIFQIVLSGAVHAQAVPPAAARRRHGYVHGAGEILHCVAFRSGFKLRGIALENYGSSKTAGGGAYVDKPVGGAHYFLVVFHHHNRIAKLLQLAQHADQAVGVAGVQAYGWLVEDIQRPDQAAAQRCCKIDALAFAAGECVAQAVESEISQAHLAEESEAAAYFREQTGGDRGIVAWKFEGFEPCSQFRHRHAHQFGNTPSADFDIGSFLAQARAIAVPAQCAAAVACHDHAELYGLALAGHPGEICVDSFDAAGAVAGP